MVHAGRTTASDWAFVIDSNIAEDQCGPCAQRWHRSSIGGIQTFQPLLGALQLPDNVRRNFLERDAEFKHGSLGSAPPARDLPMGTHKLHVRMLPQVEQQRSLAGIELLAESGDRFGVPRRSISRTKDADVE